MDGLFIIDKPAGMTSFDVVRKIKRAAGTRKVGHSGTLDPDATGVLIVAAGRATRFLRYLVSDAKAYSFELVLGAQTTTDDSSGDVVHESDPSKVGRADLEAILPSFVGELDQVPPLYSAVHVDGKRAYALARAGEEFVLESRRIHVKSLTLDAFESPIAGLTVSCGAGTYVRSLARDIGLALGTHGHARAIRRVIAGEFSLDDATPLALIEENAADFILPSRRLVAHLEDRVLNDEEANKMSMGQYVLDDGEVGEALVLLHDGVFVGVGRRVAGENAGLLKPERMW